MGDVAKPRLVVGITGASGAIYGIRLLERLRELDVETHLIVTSWARVTIEHETSYTFAEVKALADVTYGEGDQAAPVSSGSFLTHGMVVAPCSTKTLAAIANGFATTWSAAPRTSCSRSAAASCSPCARRR